VSDASWLIRKKGSGRIVIRRPTGSAVALNATLGALVLLALVGFFLIDTKGIDLAKAGLETAAGFVKMFTAPAAHHFTIGEALEAVLTTLALAFLTTLIGAVVALVLGLLASRNLTNARVSVAIKGFISFIRAVDTVLWVLIFAIGAGLGAVAAVIGMSFHTVGYLVKAYSEAFEEIDPGVIDALKASGATRLQIIFQTFLPSSITYLLSWTFFRFEINFGVAVAMGAAAGAGGIGYQLFMAAGYYMDIREMGLITYLLLAVALIMELIALRLKSRFHIHG
jgi:phosphonate transport system permease protein